MHKSAVLNPATPYSYSAKPGSSSSPATVRQSRMMAKLSIYWYFQITLLYHGWQIKTWWRNICIYTHIYKKISKSLSCTSLSASMWVLCSGRAAGQSFVWWKETESQVFSSSYKYSCTSLLLLCLLARRKECTFTQWFLCVFFFFLQLKQFISPFWVLTGSWTAICHLSSYLL